MRGMVSFELGKEIEKDVFRLVMSVEQRKNSESLWGIEPNGIEWMENSFSGKTPKVAWFKSTTKPLGSLLVNVFFWMYFITLWIENNYSGETPKLPWFKSSTKPFGSHLLINNWFKKLELLSATPLATLTHLSCSPNLRIFRALQTSRVLHIPMNARWSMNLSFYNIFKPMENFFLEGFVCRHHELAQ